jgi:DNA replication and repair protein RecF
MIKYLRLTNFRSYGSLDAEFGPGVNVLTGMNGQGKTNILEAVFFAGMLRSFRTSDMRCLKKTGGDGFRIECAVSVPGREWDKVLEIERFETRRSLRADGKPVPKASDFIGQFKVVAFTPEDIGAVSGNSSLRRRFFDIFISSVSPVYLRALGEHARALTSRNAALKAGGRDLSLIKAYEPIIARSGALIVSMRSKFAAELAAATERALRRHYNEGGAFQIKHRLSRDCGEEGAFLERLDRERDKDRSRGISCFGPQTDDFDFLLDSRLLRTHGSNGQRRLAALCMKLAQMELLSGGSAENGGGPLVTLVDDVTGDLDAKARAAFYSAIQGAGQRFFAFTEPPSGDYFKDAAHFRVENGSLRKTESVTPTV